MIIFSNSFIEFLRQSTCKVAQTLYRAYVNPHYAYRLMLTTQEVNYITFRDDGNISYLPAHRKPQINDSGKWSLEGRQNARPAKVIRKLFTNKGVQLFKDADFECFSNEYKSRFCNDFMFELLPNKEIPRVYDMSRLSGECGLNGSCMNGYGHLMDIYKFCPAVQILILKDKNGLLAGRSLVWKIDDIYIMDRIYVVKDYMYASFISYAVQRGWWYKKHYNTYDYRQLFINDKGDVVNRQFSIKTRTTFDHYPYIDTFCYGGDGVLYNYENGRYSYSTTCGKRTIDDPWDEIEHCRIPYNYAVEIQQGSRNGQITHVRNTTTIKSLCWWINDPEICKIKDTYCLISETVWSRYDCQTYVRKDCVWCPRLKSFILRTDALKAGRSIFHRNEISELSIQ
jgi:hypothetical protein